MKINKSKTKEWWNRYALAEGLWLIWTVLFAYGTYKYTWNEIFAAYMWAIGENIWYYGTIVTKEFKNDSYVWNFWSKLWKRLRNLLFEFWFPELLDFFIVRPFFLYVTPKILWNYLIGIIVWKFLAEAIFYWGTISLYELRKKIFKQK